MEPPGSRVFRLGIFILCLQVRSRLLAVLLLGLTLISARLLQDWLWGVPSGTPLTTDAAPAFQPVQTFEQITRALNAAPGKPVMLDVYADWCVACKEFDKYTFSYPAVTEQMHRLTLLQEGILPLMRPCKKCCSASYR